MRVLTYNTHGCTGLDGKPRPLHVEEALTVFGAAPPDRLKLAPLPLPSPPGTEVALRAACRYFALAQLRFRTQCSLPLARRSSFQVLTVLDGRVAITSSGQTWAYGKGRTVLVPADLTGVSLEGMPDSLALLSWVPDLAAEVVAPAREAGLSDERIGALGGHPVHNDLLPLLG